MSSNELARMSTDDEDDDDDAFLPPGFIPGTTPLMIVDLQSPPLPNNNNNLKSPFTGSSRKEFLRRSISALDDINEDFVDLIGLQSMQKENIVNQVDPFWLQHSANSKNQSIVVSDNVLDDQPFTDLNQTNDAMDISYYHTSPDDGLNSRIDELTADLEAEVVAGNLFLEAINTPLLAKKVFAERTALRASNSKEHSTQNMEREIAQLKDELHEARRDAAEQRERSTQLDIELQQFALLTAAEQHSMQVQCRQHEKEVQYMTNKLEEVMQQLEQSNVVYESLTNERDELRSDLAIVTEQLFAMKQEKEPEQRRFDATEALLSLNLNTIQQSLTDTAEECRLLTIQQQDDSTEKSALKSELMEIKNILDQTINSSNVVSVQLRVAKEHVNELQHELSRRDDIRKSNEELISSHATAVKEGNEQEMLLSNEILVAKGRIEDLLLERESTNDMLRQLGSEKSQLDNRLMATEANLRDAHIETMNLTASNESLLEQLRQAEDLALLVATDNDAFQEQVNVLQRELQSHRLDRAALADAMEQETSEKDRKIRSLQRLFGAMQSLVDDDTSTEDDKSGTIRSLQRRMGFLKDEYEQLKDVTNAKDNEILDLQNCAALLEQKTQDEATEWKSNLTEQLAQASEDHAKIRNLKRRIGATEALFRDEVNESTMQQEEDKRLIRSLQRRIGGLAEELHEVKEKQSQYLDLIQVNETLRVNLVIAESSNATLQSNVGVLQEDLNDAYEQEDQMQEDFVESMKLATTEVEKLHATYTNVFQYLKEQYQLVEEELFDALEREEDLKDEQSQVISEYNLRITKFRELMNERLVDAADQSELLREECLMSNADMFTQCRRYFNRANDESISVLQIEHAIHVNTLNENHVADMVTLFRNSVSALSQSLLDENVLNAVDCVESTATNEQTTSETVHNDAEENQLMKSKTLECLASHPADAELLKESKVAAVLQSPTSAFVPYTSIMASTIEKLPNQPRSVLVSTEASTTGTTFSIEVTDQIPALQIVAITEAESSKKINVEAQNLVNQSPTVIASSIRKSLHFATPQKTVLGNEKENADHQSFHSTPKISAAKAKLRSIEMSRLTLNSRLDGTEKVLKVKSESSSRAIQNPSSTVGKPISNRTVLLSKRSQPAPRVGSSIKSIARANGNNPSDVQSRTANAVSMKRTIKPKLDTGLARPNIANTLSSNHSRKFVNSISGLKKPTTASGLKKTMSVPVARGTTLVASKPKSRLPQFASSRISASTSINLHNAAKTKSVSPGGNDASHKDLFRKLSALKATSSTPLTARSERSNLILSRSVSAKTMSTMIPSFSRLASTPQSQPPSTRSKSQFSDCHFTPIQINDDVLDTTSPVSPLVTPKSESLRDESHDENMTSIQNHILGDSVDSQQRRVTAATKIPSPNRPVLVRVAAEAQQKADAAITLQKNLRLWLVTVRNRHATQRVLSAAALQRFFRAILHTIEVRSAFQKKLKSIMLIQRVWRRCVVRNEVNLNRIKCAATVLQTFFRTATIQELFRKRKLATIKIQAMHRAYIVRTMLQSEKSLRMTEAATLLQSCYRMVSCKSKLATTIRFAVIIQRISRGAKGRTIANEMKSKLKCAKRIQVSYRRRLAIKELVAMKASNARIKKEVQRKLMTEEAATSIQNTWRLLKARRTYRSAIVSAVLIQTTYNKYRALLRATSVAVRIQRLFRGAKGRTTANEMKSKLKCAIRIQASYRRRLAIKEFVAMKASIARFQKEVQRKLMTEEAATSIQKNWRLLKARRTYRSAIVSAVLIQTTYNKYRALLRATSVAVRIQRLFRGAKGRTTANEMKSKLKCAIRIQASYRRRLAIKEFVAMKASNARIQTEVQKKLLIENAATSIQKNWRLLEARCKYRAAIVSAVLIQSNFRKYRALFRANYLAVRIQCCFRGTMGRVVANKRKLKLKFATRIQALYRQRLAIKEFVTMKASIVQSQASIRIQSIWRLFEVRRKYIALIASRKNYAALRIQSFVRMKILQEQYSSLIFASILIQAQIRGYFVRLTQITKKKILVAVCIQSQWRRSVCQRKFKRDMYSILKMQRKLRFAMNLRKNERDARTKITAEENQKARGGGPSQNPIPLQSILNSVKKGKRVALGNLNSAELKEVTRHRRKDEAASTMNSSKNKDSLVGVSLPDRDFRLNTENERQERNGKTRRAALAANDLSVAIKRANVESYIRCSVGGQERLLEEIEKLKVVDLRHELKSFGVESKLYSKLRKAELVTMVFDRRTSHRQSSMALKS